MFKKREHLVFTFFLCGILCCCIVSLNAHWGWFDHFWTNTFLEATDAEITCNIKEDKTFTKVTYFFSDGSVESSYWDVDPKDPEITIESFAHGIGWSQILFHGETAGESVGSKKDYDRAQRVGYWLVPPVPSNYAHDKKVSKTLTGQFKTAEGKYSWNGSGTIKYTPIYFSVRVGLAGKRPTISGDWDKGEVWTTSNPANPDDPDDPDDFTGGTWKVKHQNIFLTWPNPSSTSSTPTTTM